ncbi:MAG: hypothetical protein ACI31G_05280 [Bacilli bacterium]
MNKKIYIKVCSVLLCGLFLFSCNKNTTTSSIEDSSEEETYYVIWKNYDGVVLEVDENVARGEMPSYDGPTPTRDSDEEYRYEFKEWTPSLSPVVMNITYTATYEQFELSSDIETYTITWVNYDDSILEIDTDVLKGTIPTYDGIEPKKESDSVFSYKFNGWNPEVKEATCNQTYKAVFKNVPLFSINGDPIIDKENNTIKYGYYPQTHINDEELISAIESEGQILSSGYYCYDNKLYTSITAKTYPGGMYDFSTSVTIVDDETYWFLVDTITWKILKDYGDDTYYLLCNDLLDSSVYYSSYENRDVNGETIYPNDYSFSNLKSELNDNFVSMFFVHSNDYLVSMNGEYMSLLSYDELIDETLGFENNPEDVSDSRTAKVTDFALATGTWASHGKDQTTINKNPYEYNGMYWTKSPSESFTYATYVVNSAGYLSEYVVDRTSIAIRPTITINYHFE